ncbi:MAG: FAD-dependent oxidoreductase [Gammaproteobacteria bacterium]|nr:FAD-dependent oxidoreductase [Gammaproteobacteria bacterium]
MRLHFDLFSIAQRSLWPVLDVLIRLWIAQAFFVSGIIKLSNWENALYLARHEYPVAWLDPVTAACTGAAIEIIAPPLLVLGLGTRVAALPMLILSLVIQFSYTALDTQLAWAALLGGYVVMGPGPLSLDHALRGLADSAIPLAARAVRAAARLRVWFGPVYAFVLRSWLASALLVAADPPVPSAAAQIARWLPYGSVPAIGAATSVMAAALLLSGLATRYVALLLMFAGAGGAMLSTAVPMQHDWLLLLAIVALRGPGPLSLDRPLGQYLKARFPELEGKPAFSLEGLPRVVIVGAGFGGLACAAALRRTRVSVTLIDRANYHLFQPLLYQVATAGLSPGDIAAPVRALFRDAFNVRVLLGTVTGVDTGGRTVLLGPQRVPYDHLVVATGATHGYFGRDDWQAHAPGLKRIEDATEIRRRLLTAFERAEASDDERERGALTTFLIVGGGPTGVELAGAIAELARYGMDKDFRRFDPASARIVLVQAGPRVLPAFPERLSAIARSNLERLGVEVFTNSRVEAIDADGVLVDGARIAARTVLWAAGVVASPAARWLGAEADKAGRVVVGPDLGVPGLANVYVIGDTAASNAWNGQAVPGLAPAARQGGRFVATVIRAHVEDRPAPRRFTYRHAGSLATIGRQAAVAQLGTLMLWGAPAWWLWGLVHVGFLVGMRNRIATMLNWFWSYLTFRSAVRLITGDQPSS